MSIAAGVSAPDFSLKTADGETVTLSKLRGQVVILYFYPKDDTSGCTAQACAFRDNMARVQSADVKLIGVSPDNEKSHKKFADKYELPFPLLADTDHHVAEDYLVWVEKSMYGKKYFGIERTTFIINKEGYIEKVFNKVKVPGHVDEVLKAIEGLSSPAASAQL